MAQKNEEVKTMIKVYNDLGCRGERENKYPGEPHIKETYK